MTVPINLGRLLSRYGLLWLLLLLIVVFSLAKPDTFPTLFNIRSIASSKAIVALAALAVMMPLAAGQFDLSVGFLIGLGHILVVGLQTQQHLPWPVAVVLVLACGACVGGVNGILVTKAHVNSFITTLGVGTILAGLANWYTNGAEVIGSLSDAFTAIASNIAGVPVPALFVVIVAIALWLVLEFRPAGRRLYVIGMNPRAAELTGIPVTSYIIGAFVVSGLLTASAGIVLGATLRVGEPSVGPEYLLPAFAGALLGSTTIRPGRVNVWGTIFAVLLLAVAVSGLLQLGAEFYVEDLFNGTILVVAVALAVYGERRRQSVKPGRQLDHEQVATAPRKDELLVDRQRPGSRSGPRT